LRVAVPVAAGRAGLALCRNPLFSGRLPAISLACRLQIRTWSLSLLLAAACVLAGCTTRDKTAGKEKEEPADVAEAPLGSRIKRKTTVSPIDSASRQMIEQQRVQQGAIQNGMATNPAKYGQN